MKCIIKYCKKEAFTKSRCRKHYYNYWKSHYPESYERCKQRNRMRRKKLMEDTEYKEREKLRLREINRKLYKKRMKDDPDFAKKKSQEYRKKYPERFVKVMAKTYMKRLKPQEREKILEELE